jgi:hypothetical protein
MKFTLSKNTVNRLLSLIVMVVALALVTLFILDVVVVMFLILLSLATTYFVKVTQIRAIGLEMVTFVTAITGFVYGSTWGAVIGFLLITFHLFVSQYIGPYILWVIPEYVALGILASTYSDISISTFGIYATIGINLFNLFVTLVLHRGNLGKYAFYSITNVMINIFLFLFFGPMIVGLLT